MSFVIVSLVELKMEVCMLCMIFALLLSLGPKTPLMVQLNGPQGTLIAMHGTCKVVLPMQTVSKAFETTDTFLVTLVTSQYILLAPPKTFRCETYPRVYVSVGENPTESRVVLTPKDYTSMCDFCRKHFVKQHQTRKRIYLHRSQYENLLRSF